MGENTAVTVTPQCILYWVIKNAFVHAFQQVTDSEMEAKFWRCGKNDGIDNENY